MGKLTVNVDGGARGNPGPAAIGVVVRNDDGAIVEAVGETIGRTTNNVAEYKALLRGIELASAHGADEVELIGDSELIAKQVLGQYKVKNAALKPLHGEALASFARFRKWSIRTVPRAQNADAEPEQIGDAAEADDFEGQRRGSHQRGESAGGERDMSGARRRQPDRRRQRIGAPAQRAGLQQQDHVGSGNEIGDGERADENGKIWHERLLAAVFSSRKRMIGGRGRACPCELRRQTCLVWHIMLRWKLSPS